MTTQSIVRIHTSILAALEDPILGGLLVEFLLELERNPSAEQRIFLADSGFRRIEVTRISDLCVAYDLDYRISLTYPSLASIPPREIFVWDIGPREHFEARSKPRGKSRALQIKH